MLAEALLFSLERQEHRIEHMESWSPVGHFYFPRLLENRDNATSLIELSTLINDNYRYEYLNYP